MKILSLNCRGLGQPEAVREVRSLCQLHCPAVVFLSETHYFDNRVDGLVRSLGMEGGLGVGSLSRGGGLALFWSREVVVNLESYDKLHIDVTVRQATNTSMAWRFTGFYGESRKELRHRNWECLQFLKNQSSLPWLCAGDFNEVLAASEQFGGLIRPERQMDGFRTAVSDCGFVDLGFIGLPYTWDNRQQGDRNVKVRLDRGLANASFLDLFREVKVWHIQTTESDHCCLILECLPHVSCNRRKKKNFRYENMWCRDPSYMALIRDTWDGADGAADLNGVQNRLGKIQGSLQDWEHNVFGSVRKTLANLRKDLEHERGRSLDSRPSRKEHQLMARISEMLSREEIMEKQRSRIDWVKDGDRNTALFQAKARERAKRNKISVLKRDDGSLATSQDELESVAIEFYKNLFTAQNELRVRRLFSSTCQGK